mgnify:CR=1 FL=1
MLKIAEKILNHFCIAHINSLLFSVSYQCLICFETINKMSIALHFYQSGLYLA